jgi:hypothetical protein
LVAFFVVATFSFVAMVTLIILDTMVGLVTMVTSLHWRIRLTVHSPRLGCSLLCVRLGQVR